MKKYSRFVLTWILFFVLCASVAKPLVAKSHELSLAYDELSLQKLEPPLVLQEFINHGMRIIVCMVFQHLMQSFDVFFH